MTINATDCSDEEILQHIQETRGEDELHYSWKWIILRTLKILVRDYMERHGTGSKKPGTLTEKEQKNIAELASTGRLE